MPTATPSPSIVSRATEYWTPATWRLTSRSMAPGQEVLTALPFSIEKGSAVNTSWPGAIDRLVNLHVAGVQYSVARLTMLGLGVAVGIALWLWLYRTKTGLVIRAGVADGQLTSA